jgi:hypothetical protein
MAKKPPITTIASGYYSRTALNTNFENLRDQFDNTLSLDGSTPNAMQADLDMNSNDILNAGEVNVEALTIDGVAVFPNNTQLATTYATQNYTGNGSTTTYAMGFNPATKANVDVYIDGVYQNQDAFNISGTNLTFTAAPPLNSAIEIKVPVNLTGLVASDSSQVTYTQGGTGAQTRTVQSRLRDFVSVKDFGLVGDGVTDNTSAFNSLIAAIPTNSESTVIVYFPSGQYHFNSQPNNITSPIKFVGDGVNRTVLRRNFSPTSNENGLFNFRAGANGSGISNVAIISATGTSGGCLISLVASASGGPDFCRFSDLYLTSNNSDVYKIFIDGSLRTSSPQGVRDTFIGQSSIFGGTTGGIYAKGAIALHIMNTDTFPAGGTSGKIVVTGDGTVDSFAFYCSGGVINGFSLDNLQYGHIHAAVISGDITNASSAANITVDATVSGTVQSNWTNSIHRTPTTVQGSQTFTGSVQTTGGIIKATRTSGSVTNIGHIGDTGATVCTNGNESFTFVNPSAKLFTIATGGGAAALVFADYKSSTITLLSDPSSEFEASGTPTAGKTGIIKSTNSHTIQVISNVGSLTIYAILNVGSVSSTTDPV